MTMIPGPAATYPHSRPSRPPRDRAWLKRIIALVHARPVSVAVVAMLVVIVSVVVAQQLTSPKDVARAYLEAVQAGDVESAMSYVERRPAGAAAHFLTPQALSSDWDIESLSVESSEARSNETIVSVETSSGDSVQTMFIQVDRSEDAGWVVDNPFVSISFANTPFEYASANGVTAPSGTYYFFPGPYAFYEDADATFTFPKKPELFVLDMYSDEAYTPMRDWEVSDAAVEKAQEATNTMIDDCAERFAVPLPPGCPFGSLGDARDADGNGLSGPTDIQWTVKKHPRIGVERQESSNPVNDDEVVAVVTQEPGVMQLRGTGHDRLGNPIEFSMECPIELEGYTVSLDVQSEFFLDPPPGRNRHSCEQ